jgi:tRNA G37 N-methylase Trm5
MHALQQLLEDAGAAAGGGGELGGRKQRDKSRIELEGAVPRKWEEYSDMIVLPEGSLQSSLWEGIDRKALWRTAAEALGVARLAVKGEVDKGRMRSSHVNLVHPPEADGWVSVTQNGITYTFDVTRVMFSRGNVNERRRMGAVNARGETVVDLYAGILDPWPAYAGIGSGDRYARIECSRSGDRYAGIGYFTVPLLAQAGAAHLYACELNPDSVEALRRNLRGNAVDDRCTVLPGDNAVTAPKLKGLADRVNLGLLPSSELG